MKKEIEYKSMLCPITKQVMVDPVKASDGQIYERKAIQEVIDSGGLSPFNSQPLTVELKSETELQEAIVKKIALELIEIMQENPELAEALQKRTNKPLDVIMRYSSLEHLPNDILKIIGDHVGAAGRKRLAESSRALLRFFGHEIRPSNAEFTAFLNPILRAKPNEVKAMLLTRPDLVLPEQVELTKLLIHVVKGEITEAEAMLTENPGLLLAKGQVIDFSGRSFFGKGITAFQYALAAQDIPMTKMLLKHFPKSEEGEIAVAWQYGELGEMLADKDANKHRALKNLNHSIDDLHKKLGAYIEKYNMLESKEFHARSEEANRDWLEVVGEAQRKLPAWVIMMMCEERADNKVAWVLKNIDLPVERNSEHLIRWFDPDAEANHLGSLLVYVRGCGKYSTEVQVEYGAPQGWEESGCNARDDHEVLGLCQLLGPGELPPLDSLYSTDVLVVASTQSR